MFCDEKYDFQPGEDIHYSIYDITIAETNRPHKHKHVEEGLSKFTSNWEMVERSELRRGSTQLYLIQDEFFVRCSRNGIERAGNSIWISQNSPDRLVYNIVCSVFEGVLERNSIEIKEGINKEELISGSLNFTTPKQMVLAQECSQDEIESYYDELAELIYKLVDRYNESEDVDNIVSAVEWYHDESRKLYREYTNFEPTILSEVLSNKNGNNGWVIDDDDIDGAKRLYLIHHEKNGTDNCLFYIEVSNDGLVKITETVSDSIIEEYEYESNSELHSVLDECMEHSFESLQNKL